MVGRRPTAEESIKIEDDDLEQGYADEPSITWGPGTKSGREDDENPSMSELRKEFRKDRAQERFERATVDALLQRSFHLPQNTKAQDWKQYMANTHPFWALCCADRRGFGFLYRFIVFATSILVAFSAVNAALWWAEQPSMTTQITLPLADVELSLAMLSLWTWMGLVHALHDCTAWYGCLFSANDDSRVIYSFLWLMVWAGAGTTFAALLSGTSDEPYDYIAVLVYTAIELGISWVIWYPLIATLFFSGILGCGGRLPILGGRPRDLKLEHQRTHCTATPVGTLESLADYDQSTIAIDK